MKMTRSSLLFAILVLTLFAVPCYGENPVTLLHSFQGGEKDGVWPIGDLVVGGSTLYGMTSGGGGKDFGTVFSIKKDGSNFKVLHSFAGGDGGWPNGSLILSGSTLYGMTSMGGGSGCEGEGCGTVFSINTDGSNFKILHSFAGGSGDGSRPMGSLVVSGSTLYGMTSYGANNMGTIFSINADGGDFKLLHSFAGGSGDGSVPYGNVIISDSTLYGMTYSGGSCNGLDNMGCGTIFSISTDGTAFTLLHSFPEGPNDGLWPYGSLILSGSTLFGMTSEDSKAYKGTIFSISTNGGNFKILRFFAGGTDDGSNPYGSLMLSGSTLFGMTNGGGTNDKGAIFSVNTDGSNFKILHSFAGGSGDGSLPMGSLILSGSTLYGMTNQGGAKGYGTIFSFDVSSINRLTVTKSGSGTGTVTSVPAGIDCGETCTKTFAPGTPVSLTASPASGSVFSGWSGDCKGAGTCKITMSTDKSVAAAFDPITCAYTISPRNKTFTYEGGSVRVNITGKGQGRGAVSCPAPDVSTNADWITASDITFTKNRGTVTIGPALNDSSATRQNAVLIGNNPFVVSQKGKPCTVSLSSSSSPLFPKTGGSGSFDVTATPDDCPWTVTPPSWVTITSGTSGTGNGTVSYTVGVNTGRARKGTVNVALDGNRGKKAYTVNQEGK